MPAKTFTAPRVWKRPYTSVYSDNYRYGNSLYSGAVSDIENRGRGYGTSVAAYGSSYGTSGSSGASVISDPGVRRAILEAELLTSSDIMQPSSMQSMLNNLEASQREAASSGLSYNRSTSASNNRRDYQLESTVTTITTTGRPEASSYSAYTSAKDLAHVESELEESRARRRRERQGRSLNRPETVYMSSYEYDPMITANMRSTSAAMTPPPNSNVNPTAESHLKDWSLERCREIQTEVEGLTHAISEIEVQLKNESSAVKKQLNQDVADLVIVLDEQDRTINDLSKHVKRQHRQIDELQLNYENAAKSYTDAVDHLSLLERKANKLCHEIDSMRSMSTGKVISDAEHLTKHEGSSLNNNDNSSSYGYIESLKPASSVDNINNAITLSASSASDANNKMMSSAARAQSHFASSSSSTTKSSTVQVVTKRQRQRRTRITTSVA